jgi:hypothetical protein
MATQQLIDGYQLVIAKSDANPDGSAEMWNGAWIDAKPSVMGQYMEDCDKFAAGDWTETKTGTGTTVVSTTVSSAFNTTTSGASGDLNNLQKVGPSVTVTAGKRYWFECLCQVDDASLANFNIGLSITNTDINTPTTSITFKKPSGATALNFITANSSTLSTDAGIFTFPTSAYVKLGFKVVMSAAGTGTVDYYVGDVKKGTLATNLPAVGQVLRMSYQIKAGSAAARTAIIDYMKCVFDR